MWNLQIKSPCKRGLQGLDEISEIKFYKLAKVPGQNPTGTVGQNSTGVNSMGCRIIR